MLFGLLYFFSNDRIKVKNKSSIHNSLIKIASPFLGVAISIILLLSCAEKKAKLFDKLSEEETGISFTNQLMETKDRNVLTYEYYYNGSGVATGDLNNDGFVDIYFTGNQVPSKLYLSKGEGLKFEDVTAIAKVAGRNHWKTGVSFVDVNADGMLDIYVCYSGFGTDEERKNELFINQGNNKEGVPLFTEQAATYGIDAIGTYTSQALFFDYDNDGDLDLFLLNHANGFYSPFFNTNKLRNLRHPQFGNRLYRNDNTTFIDVSDEAGIYGSGINFGLGIAASDLNNDGYPDLYVSNDFEEQDFCYLNNGVGTFKEVAKTVFAHISRSTMGLDIADYNNDLKPDVVTLDMLPETNLRQKTVQGADQYDKYQLMVESGYGHQNTRNMLQLNQGLDQEKLPVFSEIGQLAGISNTDWSWSALLTDLDNDGWKDLFVSNGFLRDYTSLDFVKYEVEAAMKQAIKEGKDISTRKKYQENMPLYDLLKKMPSTKLCNYAFKNRGNLKFENVSESWGLSEAGVSSGATYADLDNDGDLDLIVCNNNEPVWVYRNNAELINKNAYLKVKLHGSGNNTFGIGAKVIIRTKSGAQYQELYPVRGYQSSVDYTLNFGLGDSKSIETLEVIWPGGKRQTLENVAVNKLTEVYEKDALEISNQKGIDQTLFTEITKDSGIDFFQKENEYVDFKRESLIPYELSKQGPRMASADVNGDGLEDVFIGAPVGQSAILYLQNKSGKFSKSKSQPWLADQSHEDISSLFFDADGDGDQDLYVVSGGSEWLHPVPELQDRIYENDGKGNFKKVEGAIPEEIYSGSCVKAEDFDKDGDLDLFVGARAVPGNYPLNGGNIILRNDSDKNGIRFKNVINQVGDEALFNAGMVKDAIWADIDKDGWTDLVLSGDWMAIKFFKNTKGKFTEFTETTGLNENDGWWCKLVAADIDNDGDIDFIAGNMGTNSQFKPTAQEPLTTYVYDFDNDGRIDPVMTWFLQGKSYPFNSRDELTAQIPNLSSRFIKYADFGNATIQDIFSKEQIQASKKFNIHNINSSLIINNGDGTFSVKALPVEAQFSVASGIIYDDFDGDNIQDILIAGNFFPFRVQQGRMDASLGCLLKGDGKGNFVPISKEKTGLNLNGDIRDIIQIKGKDRRLIIAARNSNHVQVIEQLE